MLGIFRAGLALESDEVEPEHVERGEDRASVQDNENKKGKKIILPFPFIGIRLENESADLIVGTQQDRIFAEVAG